jgi:hypothetical protein
MYLLELVLDGGESFWEAFGDNLAEREPVVDHTGNSHSNMETRENAHFILERQARQSVH